MKILGFTFWVKEPIFPAYCGIRVKVLSCGCGKNLPETLVYSMISSNIRTFTMSSSTKVQEI